MKLFPMKDKHLPILHSQYHGSWCPVVARIQESADIILTWGMNQYKDGTLPV